MWHQNFEDWKYFCIFWHQMLGVRCEQQGYVSVKVPDVASAQLNPFQGTRLKVWTKNNYKYSL